MSEMVERVAERIHQGLRAATLGNDAEWRGEFAANRAVLRAIARGAIAAMREPTEAMEEAGHDSGDWGPGVAIYPDADASPKGCWQAMIDAALK